MQYEARITVHENGTQKPDYNDIHRRMGLAGYTRVRSVGGHLVHELNGMYTKTIMALSHIDTEQAAIENQLRSSGFRFSIELFQISSTRTFNLEPLPNLAYLLGMLGKR